jgi:hypothetical protein
MNPSLEDTLCINVLLLLLLTPQQCYHNAEVFNNNIKHFFYIPPILVV